MTLGVYVGGQKRFTACRAAGTLLSTQGWHPAMDDAAPGGELPLGGAWGLLPTRRTCPPGLLIKKRAEPHHSRPPCLKVRAGWSGRGRQGPRLSPRRDAAWDPGSPGKVAQH